MMKRFGHKGLVVGAMLCVLVWAGSALAAGYEVRLPVEKTVRLASPQETPAAEAPKDAKPAMDEKKAAPAPKPAKPEALKPEPAPAKAESVKPTAKPKAAKAEAPKDAPAPKPEPKPKPVPKIDPLALETPPAPAPHEPLALPEGGNFVGDLEMEFESDHVILRVATNGPVEQVTFFGVKAPRKLAVDLRGPWRKKGPSVLRFGTGPVKNVVVGEHPDRLRLAVEFREGAVDPDMLPKVESGDKGVTVTIPLALHLKPS